MKKEKKLPLSYVAIMNNPKALDIYNNIIGKMNAIQGIHPIEHKDGMGNNTRTQWYHGSAMDAPMLKPIVRSTTHSNTIGSLQLSTLHEVKKELSKLALDEDIKKETNIKIQEGINLITSKKDKPSTEFDLLKILHTKKIGIYSPTLRKKHTSQYEKHLVKQIGRRRANTKMKKYANSN